MQIDKILNYTETVTVVKSVHNEKGKIKSEAKYIVKQDKT